MAPAKRKSALDARGKLPEVVQVVEVVGVAQVEAVEQAAVRVIDIRFKRGVVEAKFFEVGEDDGEDFFGAPGVAFGLEDVALGVKVFMRRLGLDEEFWAASDAKGVVWAAFAGAFLLDDFALGVRQRGAVFYVPAQGTEEWRDEICAGLSFGVAGRGVLSCVGGEGSDEPGEFVAESGFCNRLRVEHVCLE